MVILAVDWGEKRIGLAVAGDDGFAHPRGVIRRESDRDAVGHILEKIREEKAASVLIGLPLNMDGTEGEMAARVRKVAGKIGRAAAIPVVLRDERLTSQEAAERLKESGLSPEKAAIRIDEMSAVILLEDYVAELAAARTGGEK